MWIPAAALGISLTGYVFQKIMLKIVKQLTLPKPSYSKKDYDVVIVGGGIAGCALGSALTKAGKNVLVLERDMSEPDRIIGELLQPGGVQHLKDLGLGHCLEGIDAARVYGYQVFYGDEQVNLPYPAIEKRRVEGRSFHYGRFIKNLRRACEQDGAKILEGTVVSLIEKTPGLIEGVCYKDQNESIVEVTSKLVIICNGAGSSFTRQVRSEQIGSGNKPLVVSQFIGVELADSASKLPNPNHGHVFILPNGPCLLDSNISHNSN